MKFLLIIVCSTGLLLFIRYVIIGHILESKLAHADELSGKLLLAYRRIDELEQRCARQAAIIREIPPYPNDRVYIYLDNVSITIYTS